MKKFLASLVFMAMLCVGTSAHATPLAVYYFDDFEDGFLVAQLQSFPVSDIQMAIEMSGMTYDPSSGVYIDEAQGIIVFPPQWFADAGFDSAWMRDLGVALKDDFNTIYMNMYDASSTFLPQAIRTEIDYLTLGMPILSLDINRQLLDFADDFLDNDISNNDDPWDLFPF